MDENVTHMPPAWASAKERQDPAWQSFLDFMREDGEDPTNKLWTIWYVAYHRGAQVEWEKKFKSKVPNG